MRAQGVPHAWVVLAVEPHHQPEAAPVSGLDAGESVLHHGGVCGRHAKTAGSLEEECGFGFARKPEHGRVPAVHQGVETVREFRGLQKERACREAETAAHRTAFPRSS